jgi:hypothetical protein
MKSDPDGHSGSGQGGMEVATAIPVAVSSLASDPKKTTIKRVAAPASTVILPNKRSRNIIFAGNTLPQGAIPIQVLIFTNSLIYTNVTLRGAIQIFFNQF